MAVSITSRKTTVKDQQRSRRKAPRNSEPWPQLHHCASKDFSGGSGVKKPANAGEVGDAGLIPKSRRSPGERNGNPLQYSCLENPTDRGAWRAIVHGVRVRHDWMTKRAHRNKPTKLWCLKLRKLGQCFSVCLPLRRTSDPSEGPGLNPRASKLSDPVEYSASTAVVGCCHHFIKPSNAKPRLRNAKLRHAVCRAKE